MTDNNDKNDNSTSSEWTVVTKNDKRRIAKGSRRRKLPPNNNNNKDKHKNNNIMIYNNQNNDQHNTTSKDQIILQALEECIQLFPSTSFYACIEELWNENQAKSTVNIQDIVCYGIGNFTTPYSAPMWQLACALCIWGRLLLNNNIDNNNTNQDRSIYYYDPCMTEIEIQILSHFKVLIIPENERGKRHLIKPTLCFMPHCPMGLYNNLLWANWDQLPLQHVIIIGNSLSAYANRLVTDKDMAKESVCIRRLVPNFISETELTCNVKELDQYSGYLEQAVNDTYWTTFEAPFHQKNNNDSMSTMKWPPRPQEVVDGTGEVI